MCGGGGNERITTCPLSSADSENGGRDGGGCTKSMRMCEGMRTRGGPKRSSRYYKTVGKQLTGGLGIDDSDAARTSSIEPEPGGQH